MQYGKNLTQGNIWGTILTGFWPGSRAVVVSTGPRGGTGTRTGENWGAGVRSRASPIAPGIEAAAHRAALARLRITEGRNGWANNQHHQKEWRLGSRSALADAWATAVNPCRTEHGLGHAGASRARVPPPRPPPPLITSLPLQVRITQAEGSCTPGWDPLGKASG